MPQVKEHLKDLYRTVPKQRRGYLRLDMNESVCGLPQGLIKKVFSKVDSDFVACYPEYEDLLRLIAKHNNLEPENICLSNGSDGAIKYIFDAYVRQDDKILLTDPTFAMYPVYGKMFGARTVMVPYLEDFSFPAEEFLKHISEGVRIAVVVNPNNPTGSVVSRKVLLDIINQAKNQDVLLVVDEAYFYYYPHTMIEEVKRFDNLIVLRTFSKLCGMAALRVGYAAACPEIAENLRRVKPTYDINAAGVILCEEIMKKPAVIKQLIDKTNKGRLYLSRNLEKHSIEYRNGHANFTLIKCGSKAVDIGNELAKEKILVGYDFGQDILKDYIRITLGDRKAMCLFWEKFIRIWKGENN